MDRVRREPARQSWPRRRPWRRSSASPWRWRFRRRHAPVRRRGLVVHRAAEFGQAGDRLRDGAVSEFDRGRCGLQVGSRHGSNLLGGNRHPPGRVADTVACRDGVAILWACRAFPNRSACSVAPTLATIRRSPSPQPNVGSGDRPGGARTRLRRRAGRVDGHRRRRRVGGRRCGGRIHPAGAWSTARSAITA